MVTVADDLRVCFEQFNAEAGEKKSSIEVWHLFLKTNKNVSLLYQGLAALHKNFSYIDKQIEDSPSVSPGGQKEYQAMLNPLQGTIRPNGLVKSGQDTKKSIGENIKVFRMIEGVLTHDHEDIEDEDRASLTKIVEDVKSVLDDISTIEAPLHVRHILYSKIASLIWSIENIDKLGMEPVWDAWIASHMTFLKTMPETQATSPRADEAYAEFRENSERLLGWLNRMSVSGRNLIEFGKTLLNITNGGG